MNNVLVANKLVENLKPLNFLPYIFLDEDTQKQIKKVLQEAALGLAETIAKSQVKNTPIAELTAEFARSCLVYPFAEERIFPVFLTLLRQLEDDDSSDIHSLLTLVTKVQERVSVFALSEERIRKEAQKMTPEAIHKHDEQILQNDFQIYALDYFLYMDAVLHEQTDEENIKLVLGTSSIVRLPGLLVDALQEDMLQKIVYQFLDLKLRDRMRKDFYEYRKVFLFEDSITVSNFVSRELNNVREALRRYCLSLLLASREYGVDSVHSALYMPYSVGTKFVQIENNLRT